MNPEIKRYLDEHGATYTPETLRKGLLDAGYDSAEVDTALRAWEAERAAPRPDAEDRRTFGRWALWLHVGALVAMVVLLVVLRGPTAIGLALIAAVVLGIALLIGWAISSLIGRVLLPRTGPMIALIVPAISAIALGGSCFALMYGSIQTPPTNGTVQLHVLAPRTFGGSGAAACYISDGPAGIQVTSEDLGTLDGRTVGVYVTWYSNDPNVPSPAEMTTLSIIVNPRSETDPFESFGVIFSTRLEVDVATDGLTGSVQFEGLAAEHAEGPEGASPSVAVETISGSVGWTCEPR